MLEQELQHLREKAFKEPTYQNLLDLYYAETTELQGDIRDFKLNLYSYKHTMDHYCNLLKDLVTLILQDQGHAVAQHKIEVAVGFARSMVYELQQARDFLYCETGKIEYPSQEFSLEQILSITCGTLLCSFSDLESILNFMTQKKITPSHWDETIRACKPYLLEQLPFLTEIDICPRKGPAFVLELCQIYGFKHIVTVPKWPTVAVKS